MLVAVYIEKMNIEQKIDAYAAEFCPFGYRDIQAAIETAEAAGKDYEYAAHAVENYSDATGARFEDCDPVYAVYYALQQEARTEIEQATGRDISNDEPYSGVNISGNYICTSFDGKEEAYKATRELIDTMKERSEVVEWYYNQLSY